MKTFFVLVFGWALLCPGSASLLLAQSSDCNPPETHLQASDPAYRDAMELAQSLSDQGFTVRCVLQSKLGAFFEDLEGAALYRTNYGDFDVMFLPKPRTFAGLQVTDHSLKQGYAYSFAGSPKPRDTNRMESVRRQYFVKHGNQLLVLDEDQLRSRLETALNTQ